MNRCARCLAVVDEVQNTKDNASRCTFHEGIRKMIPVLLYAISHTKKPAQPMAMPE
ncbi:MAG: hypothetical protein IKD30_05705 [Peptococcaceae bacterium]|nr:hypothetical protein [Peptococcaceae bacterium]